MANNNHYLDAAGLTYLCGKIKGYVTGIVNGLNIPSPGSTTPAMDSTGNTGTSTDYARADHVHPSDTTKADKVSGGTTGNLVALDANGNIVDAGVSASSAGTDTKNTAGGDDTASKIYLVGMTAQTTNDGSSRTYTHDTVFVDTSGALNSPTQAADNNSTKVATTAFVKTAVENATGDITDQIGQANGIAGLDSSGKVPTSQLPSYVDDVIESYIRSGQTALSSTWLATGSASGTVITPESGKIYVLMNSDSTYAANTEFRWGGTTYVQLNDSGCSSMTTTEMDNATSNWT